MRIHNALVIVGLISFGYMANDVIGSLVQSAQAEVADMDYQDLMRDRDFGRAVEEVLIDRMRSSRTLQEAVQNQVPRAVMGHYELMRDSDFATAVDGLIESHTQTSQFENIVEDIIEDQVQNNRTVQQAIQTQSIETIEGQCHVSNGSVHC